jgi:hypothetical protein
MSPKSSPNDRSSDTQSHGANNNNNNEKGLLEVSIFIAAIATGTACSILSKVLFKLQGIGSDGTVQYFDKPLVQTLGMFLAMIPGLLFHWIIIWWKIPFPGYKQYIEQMKKNLVM